MPLKSGGGNLPCLIKMVSTACPWIALRVSDAHQALLRISGAKSFLSLAITVPPQVI